MHNPVFIATGILLALLLTFPCGPTADATNQSPQFPPADQSWGQPLIEAKVGGKTTPDGAEVQIDLPNPLHLQNKGGRDGAGLCLLADTPINTLTGVISISKLNPSKDYIYFVDQHGRIDYTKYYQVRCTGYVHWYRSVTTVDGRRFNLTADHQVAVWTGDKNLFSWKRADNLSTSDTLVRFDLNGLSPSQVLDNTPWTMKDNNSIEVWDIQINVPCWQNHGNFFANGILVHNCVFTSINHSAYWQNVEVLQKFRDWMTKHPGGGYPSKVDKMIKQVCQESGVPVPDYIQIEGGDLEPLKLACRTGRMPGITYCFSPSGRYGGQRIAHMVSLVHLDDKWAAILDNNYPGEDKLEWLTIDEFKRTYMGNGGGWGVILLNPGPPPIPCN